jgi:hypothetical protein
MRVAFVTFEYPPLIIGVIGVHILYVTEELAKTGHQIVVITRALANRGGVVRSEILDSCRIQHSYSRSSISVLFASEVKRLKKRIFSVAQLKGIIPLVFEIICTSIVKTSMNQFNAFILPNWYRG